MSYLGRGVDKISNIEKLDNITFNGASSYTLQKGGVNFVPTSAAAILISIDGVVQSGNFSVSSSTIDFGTAVAGTSTCNFIIHLGTGVLTAPSDGSVTNAKLGTAPTLEAKGSGGTAGGVKYFCEAGTHGITLRSPQHSAYSGSYELVLPTAQGSANTFLKNDGSGNLSFAAAGGVAGDVAFRVVPSSAQSVSGSTSSVIAFGTETFDIGGGFASNKFTVPSGKAGLYFFSLNVITNQDIGDDKQQASIRVNGSDIAFQANNGSGGSYRAGISLSALANLSVADEVDCTFFHQSSGITLGSGTFTTFHGFRISE